LKIAELLEKRAKQSADPREKAHLEELAKLGRKFSEKALLDSKTPTATIQ